MYAIARGAALSLERWPLCPGIRGLLVSRVSPCQAYQMLSLPNSGRMPLPRRSWGSRRVACWRRGGTEHWGAGNADDAQYVPLCGRGQNITQGVPHIKETINANKTICTPITCVRPVPQAPVWPLWIKHSLLSLIPCSLVRPCWLQAGSLACLPRLGSLVKEQLPLQGGLRTAYRRQM